jgi:putative oxidoreductase
MRRLTIGSSRKADIALWAGQGILGAMFTGIGAAKLFAPMPKLEDKFGWPKEKGEPMTRLIGAAELAGGIGSVLPAATRIAPWLTPLAAAGLNLVMILASGYHARRSQWKALAMPLALGAIAGLVSYGRAKHARIRPR